MCPAPFVDTKHTSLYTYITTANVAVDIGWPCWNAEASPRGRIGKSVRVRCRRATVTGERLILLHAATGVKVCHCPHDETSMYRNSSAEMGRRDERRLSQKPGDLPGVCSGNRFTNMRSEPVAQAHDPSRKRSELPGHPVLSGKAIHRSYQTCLHLSPAYLHPSQAR